MGKDSEGAPAGCFAEGLAGPLLGPVVEEGGRARGGLWGGAPENLRNCQIFL